MAVHHVYVWGLALFAAFGGFMFGYDIGVINGVKEMDGFRMTFNLSTGNDSDQCTPGIQDSTILGLIVSIFSVGCLIGALIAGGLSEWTGRKASIMIGGLVFIVGGAVQTGALFIWMILIGRIVAGVGVGILSMVVPVYNAEVSPKSLRGRLVSLNQLAITAGIMVSFITALWTELFLSGWRVALSIQCVLGVILVLGMILLPETPRWLVKRGRITKAEKVLTRLRGGNDVNEELSEIQSSVEQLTSNWRDILKWRHAQKVIIGVLLQIFQQLTGMNVIMYYSTFIFDRIGVAQYVSTAIVGTINFLTTILTVFLVDKVGRKSLLLAGGIGMFLSMLAAATLIVGFDIDDCASNSVAGGYLVVFFVCFFVFNFAYSWGPVAWVVTSEIYPLSIRSVAVSITTAANWVGNFIIAMLTPVLISSPLGIFGTFYLLCVALFLAVLFVLLTLPETKGESLESVERLFSKPWIQRVNLFYYLRCGCPWWKTQERIDDDDKVKLLSNEKTDHSDHQPSEQVTLLDEDSTNQQEIESETT